MWETKSVLGDTDLGNPLKQLMWLKKRWVWGTTTLGACSRPGCGCPGREGEPGGRVRGTSDQEGCFLGSCVHEHEEPHLLRLTAKEGRLRGPLGQTLLETIA